MRQRSLCDNGTPRFDKVVVPLRSIDGYGRPISCPKAVKLLPHSGDTLGSIRRRLVRRSRPHGKPPISTRRLQFPNFRARGLTAIAGLGAAVATSTFACKSPAGHFEEVRLQTLAGSRHKYVSLETAVVRFS